jgi:hypothetical protein
MVVIGAAFVMMGVSLLFHAPRVALNTLVFFGGCFAIAVVNVVEKRRFAGYRATRVEIAGGVPFRPSRWKTLLVSVWVLAAGVVGITVSDAPPLLATAALGFMALAGGGFTVLVVLGKVPVGFVRLDPPWLAFGYRGCELRVPWDAIGSIRTGEISSNAALFLVLSRPGDLQTSPPQAPARIARILKRNLDWQGAHLVVLTSNYGLDLPLFAQALERYVRDPESRAELGRRLPEPI